MRRHRDPQWRLARKRHPLEHDLIRDVEWLEVDIIVVPALEYVAVRGAARAHQHRCREPDMHVVGK